jgi:hypothetical protein
VPQYKTVNEIKKIKLMHLKLSEKISMKKMPESQRSVLRKGTPIEIKKANSQNRAFPINEKNYND